MQTVQEIRYSLLIHVMSRLQKNLTQLFQSMPVYMIRYYRKSCLALKAILLKRILHLLGNITMAIISI